jgi:hypothetical protein
MTPEEFKKRWEKNWDTTITWDEVFSCAVEWGILPRLDKDKVLRAVLDYAEVRRHRR